MITIAFYDTDHVKGAQTLENFKVMTHKCLGIFGRVQGIESVDKADFQIVINSTSELLVDPKRTIYLGSEPCYYAGGFNDFKDVDEAFAIIQPANGNCYRSQNWWIGKTYDELMIMKPPEKTKLVSTIVSGKRFLPGHEHRLDFIQTWLIQNELDLYGRWSHPKSLGRLDDKFDGLQDYKYSIAMENGRTQGYFTEKLVDVILSWTMPLYWGCTNIADYFPEGSYIPIVLNADEMFKMLGEHKINMEALAEARQLILNRYQFWATIENVIMNDGKIKWD